MPRPWPGGSGFSEIPLASQQRSLAGSPGTYFTDLLYSETIEDLRLDESVTTRKASDNPLDDADVVDEASDVMLDHLDMGDVLLNDYDMIDEAGDHLSDDFDMVDEAGAHLLDVFDLGDVHCQMDDTSVEKVGDIKIVSQDYQADDLGGDGVEAWPTPTELPGSTCLFCYFAPELGDDRQSISVFTARSSMQRHADTTHFRAMHAKQSWICPDDACRGRKFESEDHLKNHAATVHLVMFAARPISKDQNGRMAL
jgi:hypothetical protein